MSVCESQKPVLLALGDSAWTVQFGQTIDPQLHARVVALARRIAQLRNEDPVLQHICDVVPTFRSVTVHFSALDTDREVLGQRLLELAHNGQNETLQGRHWRLPACFDADMGPDLVPLAQTKGLHPRDVVERLLGSRLRVYMIGFLPGFPYMGGLPPDLAAPRLATPRQRVPAHSIAVAGEMCAVYPWDSPGGWNLLGRTPVNLFDLTHVTEPAMLAAGDTVTWYEVEKEEYQALWRQCQSGELQREVFLATGPAP